MSSTVKVDNVVNQSGDNDSGLDLSTNDQVIIKTANTTALTVDSSQNVTLAGNLTVTGTASGVGGITIADQWRKTGDTSGVLEPITDLERVDTTGQGTIGTAMSVSSGIFTFPATGIYLVRANFNFVLSGDSRYIFGFIQVTTDNSSYNTVAETDTSIHQSTSNNYASGVTESLIDVTDTSNVKVRFSVSPINTSVTTRGISTQNYTHFTFIRLGDT